MQVCILREEHHRPKLAHITEDSPGKSLLDCRVQAPCGTDGKTEAQEGRDLSRIRQLVGGTAKIQREQGTWISVPTLLHPSQ